MLKRILEEIEKENGIPYYVGGYVRDEYLGLQNKDIDIEIYNLPLEKLEFILSKFGEVEEMGKKFAILKIKGLDIDFSLPRTEKKIGKGHKGFEIIINPFATMLDATIRRDLTINSILKNAITGEIVDNFNGLHDIERKVLKCVNEESFREDPLRVFRIAQFAARFSFSIEENTLNLCKDIVEKGELNELPKERIEEEFNKLLLKGEKPSIGFNFLKDIGAINPILNDLIGCKQNPIYHPEGDVWTHTMMVIDYAAKLRDKADNPLSLMYGAVCHDLGKPVTTDKEYHSYGHDKEGVPLAEEFLLSITRNTKLISSVCKLVELHMNILQLAYSKESTIKKLLNKLEDKISFNDLLLLGEADHMGRLGEYDFEGIKNWYDNILKEISITLPKPIVTGKDLIDLGIKPGPIFKEILDKAYDKQLENISRNTIISLIQEKYIFL